MVAVVNRRLRMGEVSEAGHDADTVLRLADRGAVAYLGAAGHRAKAMVLAARGDWGGSVPHWQAASASRPPPATSRAWCLTLHLAAAAAAACGLDGLARELWSVAPPGDGHTVLPSPVRRGRGRPGGPARRHATTGPDEAFRRASALLASPGRPGGPPPPAPRRFRRPSRAPPRRRRPSRRPSPRPPRTVGSLPPPPRAGAVRFEDCELDLGRHELRRNGEVVKVEPQVFDVLVC